VAYQAANDVKTHSASYDRSLPAEIAPTNTLMAIPYLPRGDSDSVPLLVIHNLKPTFVEHR
jgi:hypothetical protein